MKRFAWVSAIATALTFPLIALGAIVRLKGAGLACPDWPLCYGRVTPVSDVIAPAPEGVKIALEVGHQPAFPNLSVDLVPRITDTLYKVHCKLLT